MALAGRLRLRNILTQNSKALPVLRNILCQRYASSDDSLERPGPVPTTPEEKAAAAKKYNMIVEDYEPYPEDGFGGWSDYPKLKMVQDLHKDPYADYDLRDERRNWGEPYHIYADWLVRTNPIIQESGEEAQTLYEKGKQFFFAMAILSALGLIGHKIRVHQPLAAKQYPYNDLWLEKGNDPSKMPEIKHYSF